MSDDLETIETQALVDELRRRSSVFFICMRPLSSEYSWSRAWGVDGQSADTPQREGVSRVLGLIELAKFDLIYVPPQ